MKAFWFHYNKPESLKQNRNCLTFHCNGSCYIINHLDISVPITTRHRKKQPRCVMAGKCNDFVIQELQGFCAARVY